MDKHELKTRCLGLPGASEEFPFGDEVWACTCCIDYSSP